MQLKPILKNICKKQTSYQKHSKCQCMDCNDNNFNQLKALIAEGTKQLPDHCTMKELSLQEAQGHQ